MTETEAKPRILETAEEVAPPAASSPSPERKKEKKHLRWANLSYTTRVTLAFALIAAMTALVAIGVVSFVWEQHFRTYTARQHADALRDHGRTASRPSTRRPAMCGIAETHPPGRPGHRAHERCGRRG